MNVKKTWMYLVISLILSNGFAYSCPYDVGGFTQGIAEENDLWIGESDQFHRFMKDKKDVIDEKIFNEVIDRVTEIYRPVIEKMGAKLKVEKKWKDGTVNAYAHRSGNTWYVSMFGGLARHKETTPDGFAMVVCHELGHHIGGYPTKGRRWASSEGQSDYFATAKCFRAVYGDDDNTSYALSVSDTVDKKCNSVFAFSDKSYFTCLRTAAGGQSLANLLASLGRSKMPSVDTPSTKVVTSHNPNHPKAQCRLDTYFQGALCDKEPTLLYGTKDYKEGYCTRADKYTDGARPLCWFSPKQAEKDSFLDAWL